MRAAGHRSVRFDIMDAEQRPGTNFMDLQTDAGFALAILSILKCHKALVHFGIKCSSFCVLNMGTSKRSACNSIGYTGHESVAYANKLLERTTLLVMLCTAMDACWTLEQPAGSFLEYYPCWRSLMLAIRGVGGPYAVSTVRFWMGNYGSKTPKRHYLVSNTTVAYLLDRGRLKWAMRKGMCTTKTVERARDQKGRVRYWGNKNLRQTQLLAFDNKHDIFKFEVANPDSPKITQKGYVTISYITS
ncbi:unnamed protein product [Symbiodinium sp. CCMP2592]|nr:unnamed protein product [Symbiodinium sp. CCMP2592]